MRQLGLPAEVAAAANTGDMQAFFKALENSANPSSEASVSGDDKNDDKPKVDKKDDKPKGDKKDKKGDNNDMALDWLTRPYLRLQVSILLFNTIK